MKIFDVQILGLDSSLIASSYPMKSEIIDEIEKNNITYEYFNNYEKNLKRGLKLGNAKQGSGHDCFLKGIIVQFDLKAPEYFWRQFDRYHFHDYISSQSKMHCLLKFNVKDMCNQYVDDRVIAVLKEHIDNYNNYDNLLESEKIDKNILFQKVVSNCPCGFELTARITSSYLQEKSIYFQRKNHKLEEWKYYCNWLETLPNFKELCLNVKE